MLTYACEYECVYICFTIRHVRSQHWPTHAHTHAREHVYKNIHLHMLKHTRVHVCAYTLSAQGWRNCTLAVHERANSRFLVLPDSLSIFTEITGHKYFSPLKPCRQVEY